MRLIAAWSEVLEVVAAVAAGAELDRRAAAFERYGGIRRRQAAFDGAQAPHGEGEARAAAIRRCHKAAELAEVVLERHIAFVDRDLGVVEGADARHDQPAFAIRAADFLVVAVDTHALERGGELHGDE